MSIPALLAALVLFLVVGLSAGQAASSRDEFFVAGRRGGTAAIAGSVFATVVGGSATIGVAGLAYERGLTGAWWSLVGALGLLFLAFIFVSRIRAYSVYTLPGLVERLYGRNASILVALIIVVAWTGVVSGQIVAAAHILGTVSVSGPGTWIVAFSIVLIAYAVIGGQRAILRTDVLQGGLILGGLVMVAVVLLTRPGMPALLSVALPVEFLQFPVTTTFGWSDVLPMLFLVGSVYVVGPDIYTRVLSSRDAETARRAVLWAAALVVPAAFLVVLTGMTARALAPGIDGEQALPWLMMNEMPAGVMVVLFITLVSALMSSADSTLLGQGVVLADDVVGRLWHMDDKRIVLVSRLCVVVLGAVSLLLALSLRGVIDSLLFAYSVFTSGVVGPVLLGLLGGRWRPSSTGACAGVCLGGACGLAGVIPHPAVPLQPHLPIIGFGLSIVVALVVTGIEGQRKRYSP